VRTQCVTESDVIFLVRHIHTQGPRAYITRPWAITNVNG